MACCGDDGCHALEFLRGFHWARRDDRRAARLVVGGHRSARAMESTRRRSARHAAHARSRGLPVRETDRASDLEETPTVAANPADLVEFSAKWWVPVPSVEHPLLGEAVRRWWAHGHHHGLLEQQVSISWGLLALGGLCVSVALAAAGAHAPRCAGVVGGALWAWFCSRQIRRSGRWPSRRRPHFCTRTPHVSFVRRFGIVVALTTALLAGPAPNG